MFKGIKPLAVLAGVAFGVIGSFAGGLIFGACLLFYKVLHGTPMLVASHQMSSAALTNSIPISLCMLGLGGFVSFIGAFIAAWIARTHEVKNGLAVGIVSTLVSLPFCFFCPLWYDIAGIIFTLVPAYLGGYVAPILLKRTTPSLVP